MTGDPVSWKVVEQGWKVHDASGGEVGRVAEVRGDAEADIFDGVVVYSSLLSKNRYVASEHVREIREGEVHLALDALPDD